MNLFEFEGFLLRFNSLFVENRIHFASERDIKKASGLENVDHTRCVAEVSLPDDILFSSEMATPNWLKTKRILILDGVSDPGNMGSIMRSAWYFGWDGIVTLKNRSLRKFSSSI